MKIRLRRLNLIPESSCDPLKHLSRRVEGSDIAMAVYPDKWKRDREAPTVGTEGPTQTLAIEVGRKGLIHNSKVEATFHT